MSSRPDVARALVEALAPGSGIGLAVHDADLRMLLISPSLAELSGTSAEAQLGRRLTEALPGEVGEVAEASLRHVAATREPLLRIEPAVEAGRERGWLISVYPLEHEGRELIAVIALDVTESRRADERLRRSRELLAEAQRMAGVGSWSWDVRARSWTWSEELFRLTGLDPAAGPPGFEALLAAIPAASHDALRQTAGALREGKPHDISLPLVLPGGERRVLHVRGVPVRERSGAVVRVDGFAQDVTERSRAEAQQRTAAALGQLALSGMPIEVLDRRAAEAVAEAGDDDLAFKETVANIVASAAERLRAEAALEEHSSARGRLVAQTLDAEDRARRDASEALHDGPLQDLLALGHEISRRSGERIVLEVSDDGVGIPAGRLGEALGQGHIGVASSVQRVEALGGRMTVGPRAGGASGTQAIATLPLD